MDINVGRDTQQPLAHCSAATSRIRTDKRLANHIKTVMNNGNFGRLEIARGYHTFRAESVLCA